jgi:hypothetical protein
MAKGAAVVHDPLVPLSVQLWANGRCRSVMKNFAVQVRVGRIAGVHRIVKQPARNVHRSAEQQHTDKQNY